MARVLELAWLLQLIVLGSACDRSAASPKDTGSTGYPDAAAIGSEGGPCYSDGTCNAGLACQSGVCVEQPDGGGGDGPPLEGGTEPCHDGPLGQEGTASCPNGVDGSTDISTAFCLAEGKVAQGYVCPTGDQDFFEITVPSGKSLVSIKLKQDAKSPVALSYAIQDSNGQTVAKAPPWNGTDPRAFDVVHCLSAGTYYVVVLDEENDSKDGYNVYSLSYNTMAEPDTNESPTRNDSPEDATVLSPSFACGGPEVVYQKFGWIASTGDVDFYRLDVPSCASLVVSEVSVDFNGPTDVVPQVVFVYPHLGTSCTEDACCTVTGLPCADWVDCLGTTFSCVAKGSSYC